MLIIAKKIALSCSLIGFAVCATNALAADVPAAISAGIAAKLLVRGDNLNGVQVIDLRSQRPNDVLVVQAEVSNQERKDVRIYYRFRWIDAAGMQVGDGEVWKPLVILGKQSQYVKGIAYGPQATDFKIELSSEPR